MSLDEVKRKTSSSQYILWMEYLEWEVNAFDKTCYYLAQIAAEINRPYVKKGKTISLEDFILNFKNRKVEKQKSLDVQTRANKMKRLFFGLTGLVGKKKGK